MSKLGSVLESCSVSPRKRPHYLIKRNTTKQIQWSTTSQQKNGNMHLLDTCIYCMHHHYSCKCIKSLHVSDDPVIATSHRVKYTFASIHLGCNFFSVLHIELNFGHF